MKNAIEHFFFSNWMKIQRRVCKKHKDCLKIKEQKNDVIIVDRIRLTQIT